MSSPRLPRRAGFAMITVLWVMVVGGVVAAAAMLSGRNTVDAGRNRVEGTRAHWRALGCARRAQAVVDDTLMRAGSPEAATVLWRRLDRIVAASPLVVGCEITLEAAGTKLDLNTATGEMFARLLAAARIPGDPVQLSDEIVMARDTLLFADATDLARVRALSAGVALDGLVTVEHGRIFLGGAPAEVLVSVPGISDEAAQAIIVRRTADQPLADLTGIIGLLSTTAREELVAHYDDASRSLTGDPDAWTVRARAASGPSTIATVDLRLVRAEQGVAAVAARSEP